MSNRYSASRIESLTFTTTPQQFVKLLATYGAIDPITDKLRDNEYVRHRTTKLSLVDDYIRERGVFRKAPEIPAEVSEELKQLRETVAELTALHARTGTDPAAPTNGAAKLRKPNGP